ncbi:hypothetical protein BT63DRAFT_313616 [Microthyrium microscopicum]|uniref:WSC domain-containing protein n=1 Tax=Microthyrium microscopicum TaxID=703497 RepID=A0A6A6U5S8_9PEZI|nr:hypothetical protein BT63DRAFT_313616 [Microthyrium microscopicum]
MFSRTIAIVLASASLLFTTASAGDTTNTAAISSPTAQPTGLRTLKYAGCFSSAQPMINHGPYNFQSSGNCQKICYLLQNTAMALGNGTDCWCGDMLPALSDKVDDDKCNTPCAGYPGENCGASDVWTVYQTSFTLNTVPYFSESVSSASPSITAKPATQSASASAAPVSKGGSNAVGIAVGVIVGLIVLAAIAGAGFMYMRRKQQRDLEEFKKQNDVSSFVGGSSGADSRPSMWAPDGRLDGANDKRNSVGSIADNADYSRRILQVRNPDDGF